MNRALITGGAGFFGDILKRRLLSEGWECVSIDRHPDPHTDPALVSIRGDIRNTEDLDTAFGNGPFNALFHCAAMLAHGGVSRSDLWTSNVDGTRNVAEYARAHGVPNVVFTSSNCLWGKAFGRPITEEDEPEPCETYGKSKWEGEKILSEYHDDLHCVAIRCPTIIDEGRLGLLAILFQFIDEGRRVWVVGNGMNRYQFIYAQDLASACLLASGYPHSGVFNIGSDNVEPLRTVYQYVIDKAGTKARVAELPKGATLALMRIAFWLGLSPLGPYHYRMIAEDFTFDTTRLKEALGWQPTLTNKEMLHKAYRYYHHRRSEIESRTAVAAHRTVTSMGVISLLKAIS